MIAFATLLLGLASGVYSVEVTVSGPAAAVELQLDGAPAGRLTTAPWIAEVDMGTELRPHALVARALDAEGNEISRATQWLNLPRPPAEVEIVLASGREGKPKLAELSWQSVNGREPSSIGLTLDGLPLSVGKDGRAALPPRDLKTVHVLTAELWFPPGLLARKDVVFGGEYGSEVSAELTAMPVRVRPGAVLPLPAGLQRWFAAGAQPLTVAAVEEGPGKVVVVRVPSAGEVSRHLVRVRQRLGMAADLRRRMRLSPQDRLRFVSLASSTLTRSKVPAELFEVTPDLTAEEDGVLWLLANTRLPGESRSKGLRVADGVAIAGLQAASENHRRAVVLVIGRESGDASRYDPSAVRRYLQSIHVPLFVWSLYGPEAPTAPAWGGAEDISSLEKMGPAVDRLRAELAAQKIVWVEGRHLPQAVSLTGEARGVELP